MLQLDGRVFLVAYVIVEFHFFASALYFVADVVEWSRVSVCRCGGAGLQWWTRVVFVVVKRTNGCHVALRAHEITVRKSACRVQ
jgi:hypothetical protein